MTARSPRLVAVQAEGCAPIVRAYEAGESHATAWEGGETVAFGLNVAKPLGDRLMLAAIAETGGCAIAVADAELLGEMRALGRLEGAFICPEGAATVAAARKLRESGWLGARRRGGAAQHGDRAEVPRRRSAPTRRSCSPGNRCPPNERRVSTGVR